MSIENNLKIIADNTTKIVELLSNKVVTNEPVAPAPVAPTTVEPASAPVEPAPVEPAPVEPASAPVADLPFNDTATLIEWTMNKYKEIGAERGAKIQDILIELGFNNISDVTPDKYDTLYRKIGEL